MEGVLFLVTAGKLNKKSCIQREYIELFFIYDLIFNVIKRESADINSK